MFKPLIFIPSPRDFPEFLSCIRQIKYDKYWLKYYREKDFPYPKARQFFLDHPEYTHFIICPDDLMVTVEGTQKLISNCQKYDVICGVCNVDIVDHPNGFMALSKNIPDYDFSTRYYNFYKRSELTGEIIEVGWSGTPFGIFKRHVIEKLDMTPDNLLRHAHDVGIATRLRKLGIKIHVDTSVYFYHHRDFSPEVMGVGKKTPYWMWEKDGVEIVDPTLRKRTIEKGYQIFKDSGKTGVAYFDELLDAIYSVLDE